MRANDSADANNRLNPYRVENIELERLLELHSEENHDDVCLAYLFTYRDFGNGALGLSWQGEIGEEVSHKNYTKIRDGPLGRLWGCRNFSRTMNFISLTFALLTHS